MTFGLVLKPKPTHKFIFIIYIHKVMPAAPAAMNKFLVETKTIFCIEIIM